MEKVMAVDKLWNRDFIFSCLSNLFVFITHYYLLSTLPLIVIDFFAGNREHVGYVFGIFSLAGVLIRPVGGFWLDTVDRKTVAWMSMACLFLSIAAYHWVASLLLLFILRCIHGVCWGVSTTALATLATDAIPLQQRGEGIGYYGLSMSIAMFIGPIAGLAVLHQFGYSTMFLTVAGCAGVGLLCLAALRKKAAYQSPTEKQKGLLETKVSSYGWVVFFLSLIYSGILSFIVLFAKEINIVNAGLYFFANALTVVVSRPYAGKLLDREGPVRIMCIGFLTLFATFVCLYFAQDYLLFILSALLLGVGFGIIHSTSIALAINQVEPSRRGVANATILTAFDLGFGVGSIILGVLSNYVGLRIMYLLSGFMVSVPFGIFYLKHMAKNKGEEVVD